MPAPALLLSIGADLSMLSQGLASATSMMVDFAKSAVSQITNAMESLDVMGKTADRIGIGVEALQGLQHAAGLAGVGTDELGGALEKMQKQLSDAAQGNDKAAENFTQLGLSIEDLRGMSVEDQFAAIAGAVNNLSSAQDKLNATTDIFGKGASGMLNVIQDGFAETAAEIDNMGASLSRVDIAQVEAANDAVSRLKGWFDKLVEVISVELSPYIEAAATELLGFASDGQNMGDIVAGAMEWILTSVASVANSFNALKGVWYMLESAFMGFSEIINTAMAMVVRNVLSGVTLIAGAIDAVFGTELKNTVDSVAQFFDENAKTAAAAQVEAAKESEKAWTEFDKNTIGKGVERKLRDIKASAREKAEKTVKEATDTSAAATGELAPKEEKEKKAKDIGRVTAMQITDFMNVAGLQRGNEKQVVEDPQLKQTNATLSKIEAKISSMGAVAQ